VNGKAFARHLHSTMTATVRIGLVAVTVALVAGSCRRLDPLASQPRVVLNVQNLAALALEARKDNPEGRFSGTAEPVPPGEPWRQPVKGNVSRLVKLVPAEDGLFHEQYEVTVDPTGFKGPHFGTIPWGHVERDADPAPPPTRWCKVRAVGQFGRGGELWEISVRIVAEGERVTQEPMTARRLSP